MKLTNFLLINCYSEASSWSKHTYNTNKLVRYSFHFNMFFRYFSLRWITLDFTVWSLIGSRYVIYVSWNNSHLGFDLTFQSFLKLNWLRIISDLIFWILIKSHHVVVYLISVIILAFRISYMWLNFKYINLSIINYNFFIIVAVWIQLKAKNETEENNEVELLLSS